VEYWIDLESQSAAGPSRLLEVEFRVVVRPAPGGGRSTVTLRPRLATGLPLSPWHSGC